MNSVWIALSKTYREATMVRGLYMTDLHTNRIMFLVKNDHLINMHHNKIGLHAQNIDTIISLWNTIDVII